MDEYMGMHVLITGNPVDGFKVYGPFKTGIDAAEAGDDVPDSDWWTMPLHAPESLNG